MSTKPAAATTDAAGYLSWSQGERDTIAVEYEAGASAYSLAGRHGLVYGDIKRFLEDAGLWRDAGRRSKAWRKRAQGTAPKPLTEPPEPPPSQPQESFAPMLVVDVRSGKVLLNRMDEVLSRMDDRRPCARRR